MNPAINKRKLASLLVDIIFDSDDESENEAPRKKRHILGASIQYGKK